MRVEISWHGYFRAKDPTAARKLSRRMEALLERTAEELSYERYWKDAALYDVRLRTPLRATTLDAAILEAMVAVGPHGGWRFGVPPTFRVISIVSTKGRWRSVDRSHIVAPLMKYQVIACGFWLVLFGLIGVGLAAGDAPPWVLVLVVLAIVAAQQIYCQILVPRGARARLLKAVDPTSGPPPGSTPANSVLVGRLDALSEAKDWDGLRALLSDDFAVVVGTRRFGESIYIRLLKAADRQLPGERKTDEVVVHPDEPDVIWVRSTSSGKPRLGPGFVSTTWTRVRVTPDGSRVREIARAGVLRVA